MITCFKTPAYPQLLLLLFPFLFTSCQPKEDDNSSQAIPISPPPFSYLQSGHRWVYDFIYQGQVQDSLVREIVSESPDHVFHAELRDYKNTLHEYFFVQQEQLMYYTQGQSKEQAAVLMKSQVAKNETWLKKNGNDTLEVKILETNKILQCNAGTFNCVVLEERNKRTQALSTFHLSPQYGMIRMESSYNGQNIIYLLRGKNF